MLVPIVALFLIVGGLSATHKPKATPKPVNYAEHMEIVYAQDPGAYCSAQCPSDDFSDYCVVHHAQCPKPKETK
jgi:hypothetical protein